MRKAFCLILILSLLLAFTACNQNETETTYDYDLAGFSSTMVYSVVVNNVCGINAQNAIDFSKYPDNVGKTVRFPVFFTYTVKADGKTEYLCYVSDCNNQCPSNITFLLEFEKDFSIEPVPADRSTVTMTGTFDLYETEAGSYLMISHARIVR